MHVLRIHEKHIYLNERGESQLLSPNLYVTNEPSKLTREASLKNEPICQILSKSIISIKNHHFAYIHSM